MKPERLYIGIKPFRLLCIIFKNKIIAKTNYLIYKIVLAIAELSYLIVGIYFVKSGMMIFSRITKSFVHPILTFNPKFTIKVREFFYAKIYTFSV